MKEILAGERLTIYLEQGDDRGYVRIVERARHAGLAGATVLHGMEGFGASGRVHRPHGFRVAEDVPVSVIIVDTAERLDAFLGDLERAGTRVSAVRRPATVIIYRDGRARRRR